MLATVNGLSYETSLSKENAARSKPSGGHRRYPCNRSQSLEVYHQQKRSGSDMHGDADPFEPPSKRMRQQTTDDVDGINAPSKYLEPPKLGSRSRRQPEHAEQRSAKRHRSAACALAHVQEQQLPCDIDFRDPTDLTDHEKEMLAFLQCSEDLDEEFLESTSEQPIDLLLNNPSSELRHESTPASLPLVLPVLAVVKADHLTEDVPEHMGDLELERSADPRYMERQPHLDATMRAILLDWMMEVSQEFSLGRETLYLAMNLCDRFMSRVANIPKEHLQLIGVTCLFICSKLEEIYPPHATDFAMTTDGAYEVAQIYDMELKILRVMDWQVISPTVPSWLKVFMKYVAIRLHREAKKAKTHDPEAYSELTSLLENALSVRVFHRCMELLDGLLHDMRSLFYLPSELALAVYVHVMPQLRRLVPTISPYTLDEIKMVYPLIRQYSMIQSQPNQALCPPVKQFFEYKLPEQDRYTRQTHNKSTLPVYNFVTEALAASVNPDGQSGVPPTLETGIPNSA